MIETQAIVQMQIIIIVIIIINIIITIIITLKNQLSLNKMIQLSLTTKQLQLVKQALGSYDTSYLETPTEVAEFNNLLAFISLKLQQVDIQQKECIDAVKERIARYEATAQLRNGLNKNNG